VEAAHAAGALVIACVDPVSLGVLESPGAYGIDEKSLSAVYALPALLVALVAYMLLPLGLFITTAAALSLTFAAHVHVHARYHLQDAWLARFAWFRKKRELHFIHHRNQAANFAVLEFMWDRLMGSYIPLPRVEGGAQDGAGRRAPAASEAPSSGGATTREHPANAGYRRPSPVGPTAAAPCRPSPAATRI